MLSFWQSYNTLSCGKINSLCPSDDIWLFACKVTSHHLNRFCLIVNWTHRNNLQWNFNLNTCAKIFIKTMQLKMSSANWQPFFPGFNVLNDCWKFRNAYSDAIMNSWPPTLITALVCHVFDLNSNSETKLQIFYRIGHIRSLYRDHENLNAHKLHFPGTVFSNHVYFTFIRDHLAFKTALRGGILGRIHCLCWVGLPSHVLHWQGDGILCHNGLACWRVSRHKDILMSF